MKLKTKLYFFQIVLTTILFIFLASNYYSYEHQYKKDINSYAKNEIAIYQKEILASINKANKEFEKNKNFFMIFTNML